MAISVSPEASEAETSRYAKWAIALFFVTVFIPGSFYIGVRMTPYRLFLILMIVPMVLRFRSDPTIRLTAVDAFVFLAIFWRSLSLVVNHQAAELVNAGSSFVELFGGYMLGRVFVRSPADYRYFFKCFLLTLLAFLPFALLEFTLRQRVLRRLAAVVLTQPPESYGDQIRFGFMRVQASFEHGILFGNFCATGFANMYYLYQRQFPKNLVYSGFTAFMAALGISSSSILGLALQTGIIIYERTTFVIRYKWFIIILLLPILWFGFTLVMGKNPFDWVRYDLVFNPYVGDGRVEIFVWGIKEVFRNPWFGIGLNDWVRPFWREHPTVDNFWLLSTMRSGVPHFVFLFLAFLVNFLLVSGSRLFESEEIRYKLAYLIPMFTLMLMLCTHALWGGALVYVMVYLGIGAWMYDQGRPAPRRLPRPPHRPGPARRERGLPTPALDRSARDGRLGGGRAAAAQGARRPAGASTTRRSPSGPGSRA